ncbi:MAG: hypothetical protein F6K39_03585 [Okeania sp. SIO3B3]|nr:hypothetical protein [Okeania sp. SIO3B3]
MKRVCRLSHRWRLKSREERLKRGCDRPQSAERSLLLVSCAISVRSPQGD